MRDLKRVILITIDCLRADKIGQGITPFLNELVEHGVFFSQVVTAADTTASSHASLFTSVYPPSHGVSRLAKRFHVAQPTLAEVMQQHGYRTAGAVSVEYLSSFFGLSKGFDDYFDTSGLDILFHQATRWNLTSRIAFSLRRRLFSMDHYWRTGDKTNQKLLRWIEMNYEMPFMAWIHYFDAHEYKSRAEYESQLQFVDSQVRELFNFLQQNDIADDTLFVITSDHGEAFGEHNNTGHKATGLYDEAILVPLILYWPTELSSQRVDYQVRTIDIAPTILQMSNLDIPPEWLGVSLMPLVIGQENEHRDAICYSYPTSSGTRCIRTGEWKYIHYDDQADALLNLSDDPSERWNLIASKDQQATLNELKAKIFDIENGIARTDEKLSEKDNEMVLDMLRSLGYVE
jgi:arylsulfatase A-like enzyme